MEEPASSWNPDHVPRLGAFGLHLHGVGDDFHFVGDAADLQRDVEGELVIDRDDDSGFFERTEAAGGHIELVGPGSEGEDAEGAVRSP